MEHTFTKSIQGFDLTDGFNGRPNFVKAVHWKAAVKADDIEVNEIFSTGLSADSQDFIEFQSLSEAQVLAWVDQMEGTARMEQIKNSLLNKLQLSFAQSSTDQLPWSTKQATEPVVANL